MEFMLSLADARARAEARGCRGTCTCRQCCIDEALQVCGGPVPAGEPGGPSAPGTPSRKRPTRPPTDRQLDFIANLWESRQFPDLLTSQTLAEITYGDQFGPKQASALIDTLKSFPRQPLPQADDPFPRPEGDPDDYLIERRLYAHGGRIYRVQRSQTSGRLYALRVLEDGGTEFARGIVRLLEPKDQLTLEQAKSWGRKTGTCCNCYARLTNPESVEKGIGPYCEGRL